MTNFITDIITLGAGAAGVDVNPNQGAAIATSSLANYVKDRTTNIVKKQNLSDVEEPIEIEVEIGMKADTEAHIPIVYGEDWVTPILVDAQLVNNNATMWYALALCEKTGPLLNGTDSVITFEEVYWNNQKLTFWYDGVTVASAWSFNNGRWVQDLTPSFNMKIYPYNNGSGSPTNIRPQALEVQHGPAWTYMPGWTPNPGNGSGHNMTNLVFVLVRVDYNAEAGMDGIGNLKFKLRNTMKNPGDVFYDYLNNPVYGAGVAIGEIDGSESLAELTVYSNTTIDATDNRQPNVLFSDPDPLDIQLVAENFIFPVQLSTQPIDIIGGATAQLRWIVDISDIVASGVGATVNFGELPAGINVVNNAGRYIVSGIDTLELWEAIKDANIIVPDTFQGSFFYEVEFTYRYRAETQLINYSVGTFVPVSEIKWAATLTVNSVSILDDGANLPTTANVNVNAGIIIPAEAALTANFTGEFGTRKITGYSALEFGTFTQNTDGNFTVTSALKNKLLFNVAQLGMISNYVADYSASVAAVSNISTLGGFLNFADSTISSEFNQTFDSNNARIRLSGSNVNSQFGIDVTPNKIFGIIATPTVQATASIDPVKTTVTGSNLTVNAQFTPDVSAVLEYDAEFNAIGNFNIIEIDRFGWDYGSVEKIDTSVLPTGSTGFGHRFKIKDNLLIASSKITDTNFRLYAFNISDLNNITYVGELTSLNARQIGGRAINIGGNRVVALGTTSNNTSAMISVYSIDTVNPSTITRLNESALSDISPLTANDIPHIGTDGTNVMIQHRPTGPMLYGFSGNLISKTIYNSAGVFGGANSGVFGMELVEPNDVERLDVFGYTNTTALKSYLGQKFDSAAIDDLFVGRDSTNFYVYNTSGNINKTVSRSILNNSLFNYFTVTALNNQRLLFLDIDETRFRIYNYQNNLWEGSFDIPIDKRPETSVFDRKPLITGNNAIFYSTADGNNGSSDIYIIRKD